MPTWDKNKEYYLKNKGKLRLKKRLYYLEHREDYIQRAKESYQRTKNQEADNDRK